MILHSKARRIAPDGGAADGGALHAFPPYARDAARM
jgi:hypothetical protein